MGGLRVTEIRRGEHSGAHGVWGEVGYREGHGVGFRETSEYREEGCEGGWMGMMCRGYSAWRWGTEGGWAIGR